MNLTPLFDRSLTPLFAWHSGREISGRAFLADVAACAASLPERKYVLNRCADRYLFLVGFVAAIVRNQITLCPPALTRQFIEHLQLAFPDIYSLCDYHQPDGVLTVSVRHQAVEHEAVSIPVIDAQQTVLIAFTSGSTGTPAQHAKSWAALTLGVQRQSAMLGAHASEQLGVVATVPPQHMYGLESSLLMPLQMGWTIHGGKPFFPQDIATALQQNAARNVLVTTPFHLRACVESGVRLPRLEFILSATAPLSPQLAAEAEQLFAVPVREIYGCTEAGSIASRRNAEETLWRLHDGMSLSFARGQWFVNGAHSAEPTALHDSISVRDSNHFALGGRLQDMVNIAGKRASLGDLNHTLTSIEGVRDGVFFMPDTRADSVIRLIAFVVAPGYSALDIMNALRVRLDPAFVPRRVYLVDALPRNDTGKLPVEQLYVLLRQAA